MRVFLSVTTMFYLMWRATREHHSSGHPALADLDASRAVVREVPA